MVGKSTEKLYLNSFLIGFNLRNIVDFKYFLQFRSGSGLFIIGIGQIYFSKNMIKIISGKFRQGL